MLVELEQSLCNTNLETAQTWRESIRYVLGQISACSYKFLGRVLNSCCSMQWLSFSHAVVRVHHKGAE